MIGAVAALVVVALVLIDRRGGAVAVDTWPWLLAEVEGRVLQGEPPATAAVAACLHGPPMLAGTTMAVVDALPADTDGTTVLAAVAAATGDARAERLRTAVARCDATGSPAAPVLRRLQERERDAAHARRARNATVATSSAARWLLLAPLVPVTAGAVPPGWAVPAAAAAVAAWWAAGRWLSTAIDAGLTGTWRP